MEQVGPARPAPESGQAAVPDTSVAPAALVNSSTNATMAVARNLNPAALAPPPAEMPSLPPAESGFSVMSVSSILSAAADAIAGPPLRVAAREPEPAVAPSPGPAPATTSTSLPVAPVVAAMPVPVPVPDRLGAGAMLAIGGVLLGAVAFLFIVVLRRLPRPARGSLITQSMQRE